MVTIDFEDTEILDLVPEFFVLWLSEVCGFHSFELGDVALVFCSDSYLLKMNKEHLDHDFFTDIITFDYTEERVVSGDLFISVDRVRDNANTFKTMFHVELNRVVVHGVLHLLGFGDKTDIEASRMRKLEEEALALIVSRET